MTGVPSSRLILGATRYEDARAALRLALQLAKSMGGELRGVMVEEETILRFAGLPKARTIDAAGRRMAPMGAERMLEAFRRDAAAFEKILSETARAHELRWSFASARGRLAALLPEISLRRDLVLLSGEPVAHGPDEVLLLAGRDGETELPLLAAQLAIANHSRLRILLRGEGRPMPVGLSVPVAYEALTDENALAARLAGLGASSLLVADVQDPGELGGYLEHARFPRLIRGRGGD